MSGTGGSPDGEVTSKRRRLTNNVNRQSALVAARTALARANAVRREAAMASAREALARANVVRKAAAENAKRAANAKAAENAKRAENAKAAENAKRAENAKAAENAKRAENAKAAENAKTAKKTVGSKRPREPEKSVNQYSGKELIALLQGKGIRSVSRLPKEKLIKLAKTHLPGSVKKPRVASPGRNLTALKENTARFIANSLVNADRKPNLVKQAMSARNGKSLENIRTVVGKMSRSPNYVACKRLFDIYMDKITDKKRADIMKNEQTIINNIMSFNIASNKGTLQKDTLTKSITFEQYVNILVLVWLDGIHDKYVDDYFQDWYETQVIYGIFPSHLKREVLAACDTFREGTLKNTILLGYLKSLKPESTLYKLIVSGISMKKDQKLVDLIELDNYSLEELRTLLKGQYTERETRMDLLRRLRDKAKKNPKLFESLKRSAKFALKDQWERTVKEFLVTYFRRRTTVGRNVQGIVVPPTADGRDRGILLSVDQEYSARRENSLTELIDNKTTTGLITYGQALDPGSTMLPKLITRELTSIIMYNPEGPNITVRKPSFQVGSKYYLTDMDFNLVHGSTSVFRVQVNTGKEMLTFNGNTLKTNQSARKADKATLQADKISKYFGDALQYVIATVITDESFISAGGRTKRYPYLGTGDSMALLGYSVFGAIVGVKNIRMIIDFAEQSVPSVYCVNLPTGSRLISSDVTPPSNIGNRARTNTTIQGNNTNNTAGSKRP